MTTAKTGLRKHTISPGNDVLPRYLQGSMYTTRAVRKSRAGSSGGSKLGKAKKNRIQIEGYDDKGWKINET